MPALRVKEDPEKIHCPFSCSITHPGLQSKKISKIKWNVIL